MSRIRGSFTQKGGRKMGGGQPISRNLRLYGTASSLGRSTDFELKRGLSVLTMKWVPDLVRLFRSPIRMFGGFVFSDS